MVTNKLECNRNLEDLARMGLINFVAFVVLKILRSHVSMQITAYIIQSSFADQLVGYDLQIIEAGVRRCSLK